MLAQLRHLLENGCDKITALDLLAEAELVLLNEDPGRTQQSHVIGKLEILNLSRMIEAELDMARSDIQNAGITVVRRKAPPRFVRTV